MKNLSKLDTHYKIKTDLLTAKEKEDYCNELIDRFQNRPLALVISILNYIFRRSVPFLNHDVSFCCGIVRSLS